MLLHDLSALVAVFRFLPWVLALTELWWTISCKMNILHMKWKFPSKLLLVLPFITGKRERQVIPILRESSQDPHAPFADCKNYKDRILRIPLGLQLWRTTPPIRGRGALEAFCCCSSLFLLMSSTILRYLVWQNQGPGKDLEGLHGAHDCFSTL